jgi:hypothetical protein
MIFRLQSRICGDRQIRAIAPESIAIGQNPKITDKKVLFR